MIDAVRARRALRRREGRAGPHREPRRSSSTPPRASCAKPRSPPTRRCSPSASRRRASPADGPQEGATDPLTAFLAHAALEAGDTQAAEGRPALQLMTVHSAKGLEFHTVFVTGLEEGLFPHENSLNEYDGLEEERRLMYVAITRARRRLYLTFAQTPHAARPDALPHPEPLRRRDPEGARAVAVAEAAALDRPRRRASGAARVAAPARPRRRPRRLRRRGASARTCGTRSSASA